MRVSGRGLFRKVRAAVTPVVFEETKELIDKPLDSLLSGERFITGLASAASTPITVEMVGDWVDLGPKR